MRSEGERGSEEWALDVRGGGAMMQMLLNPKAAEAPSVALFSVQLG